MAPHRIDTHHHPYTPTYIARTGDVLRHTTHAFFDRLTKWTRTRPSRRSTRAASPCRSLSISTPSVWLGSAQASRTCPRVQRGRRRNPAGPQGPLRPFRRPAAAGHRRLPARDRVLFNELSADGIALTTNYVDKYPGDRRVCGSVRRTRPAQGGGLFPSRPRRASRSTSFPTFRRRPSNSRSTPRGRSPACCSAAPSTAARTSGGSSRTAAARCRSSPAGSRGSPRTARS